MRNEKQVPKPKVLKLEKVIVAKLNRPKSKIKNANDSTSSVPCSALHMCDACLPDYSV